MFYSTIRLKKLHPKMHPLSSQLKSFFQESIQLMTQAGFKSIESIQLMTQAENHAIQAGLVFLPAKASFCHLPA